MRNFSLFAVYKKDEREYIVEIAKAVADDFCVFDTKRIKKRYNLEDATQLCYAVLLLNDFYEIQDDDTRNMGSYYNRELHRAIESVNGERCGEIVEEIIDEISSMDFEEALHQFEKCFWAAI